MQDRVVAQHLNVARAKLHVEMNARVGRQRVQMIHRRDLLRRQAWYRRQCLRLVDRGAHVGGDHAALVRRENIDFGVGLLAFRNLAPARVVQRLQQGARMVGPGTCHFVPQRGRTGDRRQPAGFGSAQAQQCHQVGGVGVVIQACAGLVAAYLGVGIVEPEVGHVAQHMALAVLRHRFAEIQAEAPVSDCRLALRIALDRDAAQQHEAAAVQGFAAHPLQQGFERGHRKILAFDVDDVVDRLGLAYRGIDFGDFARRELVHPVAAFVLVGAKPGLLVVEVRQGCKPCWDGESGCLHGACPPFSGRRCGRHLWCAGRYCAVRLQLGWTGVMQ